MTTSGAVNLFICAVAMSGGIPFPVGSARMPVVKSWYSGFGVSEPPSSTGLRLGGAEGKYKFVKDFDTKFDAMDTEVAEMFA